MPEKFGQTSNNITLAENFGDQYQRYNGMLFNVSARLGSGLQFQGGINTGKTVQDNCDVRAQVPELTTGGGVSPAVNVGNPYCHSDPGFITKSHRARQLHRPEDRRVGERHAAQRSGRRAGRQLERAGRARVGRARPAGGRRRHHGADQPGGARARCGATASTRSICASPRSCGSAACSYNVGIDIINVTNSDASLTYNQTFNPAVTTGAAPGWRRRRC